MRIAATADLHFTPQMYDKIRDQMNRVREEADVLVIAGDLTNYGRPSEMESLLNSMVRLRIPIVAVLGNHDYESGKQEELVNMMTAEGVKVLDGTAYERDGVGFAGTKGFLGGFGRGVLTAFRRAGSKSFRAEFHRRSPEAGARPFAAAHGEAGRRGSLFADCRYREGRTDGDLSLPWQLALCRGGGPARCSPCRARPCPPWLGGGQNDGRGSGLQCCLVHFAEPEPGDALSTTRRLTSLQEECPSSATGGGCWRSTSRGARLRGFALFNFRKPFLWPPA